MYKILKGTPITTLECMNVTLLNSNHLHVSDTHIAIFRVMRTRIQIQLQCVEITSVKNSCPHHLEDGHISGRNMSMITM